MNIESGPFAGLPRKHYSVLMIDPPWAFKTWSHRGEGKGASQHYKCMKIEDLYDLPVAELAVPDAAMFMWVVQPMLPEAMEVIHRWGFCVGAGTRILTRDLRWVAAEELLVGDELLGFDENIEGDRRYYRPATVISTGIDMIESCRITLETGEILIASREHPWLAMRRNSNGHPSPMKWVKTDQLLAGRRQGGGAKLDRILPRLAPVCLPDNSYESGFLAGAFDAEGSISMQKGGIRFAQNENHLLDFVRKILAQRGFKFSEYNTDHACKSINLDGGLRNVMRFLMECRPPRLLEKWQRQNLIASLYNLGKVRVESVEPIGSFPCVTMTTDTGTYIAEGFGAHNTFRTVAFCWVKMPTLWKPSDGLPDMQETFPGMEPVSKFPPRVRPRLGLGYHTRSGMEQCWLAIRGGGYSRLAQGVEQVLLAPLGAHSAKPLEFANRIDRLVGDVPRIELFARDRKPGWTAWGNELKAEVEL